MSESSGVFAKLYDDIKEHGVPRYARRQFFVVAPTSILWFVYLHFFDGKQFQATVVENLNAFNGLIVMFVASLLFIVGATIARLASPSPTKKAGDGDDAGTDCGATPGGKNVTFSEEAFALLGRFFPSKQLDRLRTAVLQSNDPDELRLVGLLSMNTGTPKFETLSKKYHLGQVYFLWMCKTIKDETGIRIALRINPYGAWTTEPSGRAVQKNTPSFAARNMRYLGISAVWSIATGYKMYPLPLVSEDLVDRERLVVAKVEIAISDFTKAARRFNFPMGNGGHAFVKWLTTWRRGMLDEGQDMSQTGGVADIAKKLAEIYRTAGTDMSQDEILALLYLLCVKFSGSSPTDIAEAVVAYCRLGENSILIECVKNKYFLDAHAALAKMAKEKFPPTLYFNGIPSCGLNPESKYMKGVKDPQKMLTVHDIVQAVWYTKIGTFGNFRATIRELFLPRASVDDAVLDAVIDREAKLLNYSIGLTTQLYEMPRRDADNIAVLV